MVSQMPTSCFGSEVIASIHCVGGGGGAPAAPGSPGPTEPKRAQKGTRGSAVGAGGHLRTAGRVSRSLLLLTVPPPASGDVGPLLTVSDTLWGAKGGSPGTEVSTRAPTGDLKSLQVRPRVHRHLLWCVSHQAPRDLGGPTLVSITCEPGAAGTREHCPGGRTGFL